MEMERNLANAASKGDWERVEKLVKQGDDVNFGGNFFARTALHHAAERGNRAICVLLLKSGANINNARNMLRDRPLHSAARRNQAAVCELLVTYGADVTARNERGKTPLMLAVGNELNEFSACHSLISNDSVNVSDRDGNYPLHIASRQGDIETVQLLVNYGAYANSVNRYSSQTPLHAAAGGSNDCPGLCEILLKHHAKINAADKDWNQPLHMACKQTHTKIVKLMMSHGADTSAENKHRQTPLHIAADVSNDCPELCEILLKHHAKINAVDKDCNQPLHLACKRGHAKAGELMVFKGADTHAVDKHGQTLLHIAAGGEKDCPELCEILLKHNAKINSVDVYGSQPLHLACKQGHAETGKLLLSYGADTNAVNKCGQTPLHTAAIGESDCPEVCEILLTHDAKIDAVDVDGSQPLHLACKQGHTKAVNLLLSHSADVRAINDNGHSPLLLISKHITWSQRGVNSAGNHALHIASNSGMSMAVQVLVDLGADTNAVNKHGQTPLHAAAGGKKDCTEVCEILLKHGAKMDAVDKDGNQPLQWACKWGHVETGNLLLSCGADTNAVNKCGQTPLHTAASGESDCPELCVILLKQDARIDAVDEDGNQPLHLACKQGHTKTVNLLLSHSADARAINGNGHSPLLLISKRITGSKKRGVGREGNHALHIISKNGMLMAVQVLVDLGADTNVVNKHGQTPLHAAAGGKKDCPEVCEILLKHGAKMDALDEDGNQPLQWACKRGHVETGNLLLSCGADTNAVNKCGQTPLHTAASGESDCPEMCVILLKQDARIDAVDEDGNQPLHLASKQGHAKAVNLLLSHSADVRASDGNGHSPSDGNGHSPSDGNGHSPLLLCSKRITLSQRGVDSVSEGNHDLTSENGMSTAVQLLVDLGADTYTNTMNKHGQTPLHAAAGGEKDCPEVCEILLKHGAKINAVNDDANHPLHLACTRGHTKAGKLLVSHGADLEAVNKARESVLHMVAMSPNDCLDLCHYLVKGGANPNVHSNDGKLPCEVALQSGNLETFQFLFTNSAIYKSADLRDVDRTYTCSNMLLVAIRTGNVEVCRQLLENGASANTTLDDGTHCLELTLTGKKEKILCLLLLHGADIFGALSRMSVKSRATAESKSQKALVQAACRIQ